MKLPRFVRKLMRLQRRYKVLYGGRGSGKSYGVADALLLLGVERKIRVLCAREFQNSITESVHFLLKQEIERLGLQAYYRVTNTSISGVNGTEFIFKGIRMNIDSIKSMAGITHVWLEEAHKISKLSWDTLIPTIREPNSEIWVTFNPDSPDDPTYTMFVEPDGTAKERENAMIVKVNWQNNAFFPDVLREEKDHLFKVNPDLAMHVWEGQCRTHSDAQIFKGKWSVRAFEPQDHWDGPYLGADFGFSVDPSTLVRVFIDEPNREILIRNAQFGYSIETDSLPIWYERMPDSRDRKIRADSARPETISYLDRQGFDIEGVEKWAGSVEDGIEWLRGWKIVIHPDCENEVMKNGSLVTYGMITEAKNYSFKVDRLTGDVLTDIVDAYNHGWDAVRYALQPMIKNDGTTLFDVMKRG